MKEFPKVRRLELIRLYCESQQATPIEVCEILDRQVELYKPTGFMLLRCIDLSSSRLGTRVILPYGPNNTFKEPPDRPISPRGLASDMSEVECISPAEGGHPVTAAADYPELYVVLMLAKDGLIVHRSGHKLREVAGLGEMMLEQQQILAWDVFELEPQRRYLTKVACKRAG